MKRRVLVVFFSFYGALIGGARGAHSSVDVVGILSIETSGVSEAAGRALEEEVEEALEVAGIQSVDRESMAKRLAGSDYWEGCRVGPCLRALKGATGVPIVLVARIVGEGSNYRFIITLVDTESGLPLSQVAQSCEVCTVDEAISTATLATISLMTGTGEAKVRKPIVSQQGLEDVDDRPASDPKSRLRPSVVFTGAGLLSLGAGVLLHVTGSEKSGAALMGAGAAGVLGGGVLYLYSGRF